jgi:hypothetical protein
VEITSLVHSLKISPIYYPPISTSMIDTHSSRVVVDTPCKMSVSETDLPKKSGRTVTGANRQNLRRTLSICRNPVTRTYKSKRNTTDSLIGFSYSEIQIHQFFDKHTETAAPKRLLLNSSSSKLVNLKVINHISMSEKSRYDYKLASSSWD